MATSKVDPALLEGEDLERWYRRTPDEIDHDRRLAEELAREEFATTRRLAQVGWSPEEASAADLWRSQLYLDRRRSEPLARD